MASFNILTRKHRQSYRHADPRIRTNITRIVRVTMNQNLKVV